MKESLENDLLLIENLFNKSETKKSMEIIEKILMSSESANILKAKAMIFKGKIFLSKNRLEEALGVTDEYFKNFNLIDELLDIDMLLVKEETLWRESKLDDSYEVLKEISNRLQVLSKEKYDESEILRRQAIVERHIGVIFNHKGNWEKALEFYGKGLETSEKIGDKQLIAFSLNNIGNIYKEQGKFDLAYKTHERCAGIWNDLGNSREIASAITNIGSIYQDKGELDKAMSYYKRSHEVIKTATNITEDEEATSLHTIGTVYLQKGDLDKSLEFYSECKSIWSNALNKRELSGVINNMGEIYRCKGELDKALDYYQQSYDMEKELERFRELATPLHNMGLVYHQKGDYDRALDYLTQAQNNWKESNDMSSIPEGLFALIKLSIDRDERENARKYLTEIQEIASKTSKATTLQLAKLSEGLILKTSKRQRNRYRAQDIFHEIVDEKMVDHEIKARALLNYAETLLYELQTTSDSEVLEEIKTVVIRILEIAKNQNSYLLLAEAYLLQGQLAILELNFDLARSLFTQAQMTADEKGLEKLAITISREYDVLIDKLKLKGIEDQDLSKRLEFTNLEDILSSLSGDRLAVDSVTEPEDPIMFLILNENGITIYSKSFRTEQLLDNQLLGGFLSAIEAFSLEIFSGSIERIKLGEYRLVMQSQDKLKFYYIFKGESYPAIKKISKVITNIKENSLLWEDLNDKSTQVIVSLSSIEKQVLDKEVFNVISRAGILT